MLLNILIDTQAFKARYFCSERNDTQHRDSVILAQENTAFVG